MKILRNSALLIIVGFMAWIMFQIYENFDSRDVLNPISEYYAENAPRETGAANIVTSIVVTYRGLDTLGEVTILFLAAAIIGLLLKTEKGSRRKSVRESSEFLTTASGILIPVISLFGVYIFINGHLTPGGGFQGGAVLASSFILVLLAISNKKIGHRMLDYTEAISGVTFILLGVFGILLAGGFLDNKILPLGTFGTLFSAGAIPLIYSLIGLKVGAELSNIILELNQIQGDEDEVQA